MQGSDASTMEHQMQANFLNHILSFFAPKEKDEGNVNVGPSHNGDVGDVQGAPSAPVCPDLPVLLGMLLSSGFRVKYSDKGERGGASDGCRAIIICKRSGTRVVMDGEGPCTCPPQECLNKYLHPGSAGQAPSRPPSPTPSAVGQLEDPLNTSMTSMASSAAALDDADPAPPRLNRQRTWSRDADNNGATQNTASPANRRLSAPPGSAHSPWTTLQGDDLNVLAAADLLQEAMSLLSGVKKVNLRNTPVGPSRRLSAASRRLSSDVFVQPLRPLSRTSSASSGLGSIKSAKSTQADTPRPAPGTTASTSTSAGSRPASAALRRTISAAATMGTAKTPATSVLNRTRPDFNKKVLGTPEVNSGSRGLLSKMPSLIKPPSNITKTNTRTSVRVGIKTNATLTMAKTAQPKIPVKSPEVESVKL